MRYTLFVLLITSLFGIPSSPSYSEERDPKIAIKLNLTAQSLHASLMELASQTGLEILFSKGATATQHTPALIGNFTLEHALSKLLEGTGLYYTLKKKQIRIIKSKEKSHSLPKITVTAYLRDDQDWISYGDDSQQQFPLYQLPLSIQSISKKQIEAVQATNIDEAISFINGIEYLDRTGGFTPQYYSRGIITPFSIDGKFYRRTLLPFDPGLLERIDLIQGPSANYMNPGGTLNFVTKKPKLGNRYQVSLTHASEDFYRTEMDINISSKRERKKAFRFIATAEDSNHVKDFAYDKRYALSSSFAYEFKNDSQFLLSLIHQHEERYPTTFTYHDSVLGESLPRNYTLGLPWAEAIKSDSFYATEITNLMLSDWVISGGANYNYAKTDSAMAAFITSIDNFENALATYFYTPGIVTKTYGLDAAAERSFSFFDIEGLLRIGLDYQFFDQRHPAHAAPFLPSLDTNSFLPFHQFNIDNPDYSYPKPPPSPKIGSYTQLTDFYGIHISQNYYLTDALTVYADVRYEDMQFKGELIDLLTPRDREFIGRYKEYTPKLGINFSLSESFSSHLSYTESFSFQSAVDPSRLNPTGSSKTDFTSPIKNEQYELALKKRWLDNQLQSNLVFYKTSRSNIQVLLETAGSTEVNLDPPSQHAVKLHTPDQHSEGVSLELSGDPTEDLSVITNISYNDSNIVDERTLLNNPDNRAYASAKIVANTWINYAFSDGKLDNTSMAFGVKHVGERYGDNDNSFTLPAYTIANAFVSYSGIENFTFKIAVRNIFNKYYYKSSLGSRYLVEEGAPRSISFSIQSAQNF